MRKTLLLQFFLCALFFCSQSQGITCSGDTLFSNEYKPDAFRMTLRNTLHNQTKYKDSINLNLSLYDTLFNAIKAVGSANSIPEVDTVLDILNIHADINPSTNSILVSADTGVVWMKQLKAGVQPTGYQLLDSFVQDHEVVSYRYIEMFDDFDLVEFHTLHPLNTTALSKKFKKLQGVANSEPISYSLFGDETNIVDSITPQFIQLTFSYGWGDCALGCIYKRYWKFRVNYDCSVSFIGTYGNPLFPITAINESQKEKSTVVLHPNPAITHFTITTPHNLTGNTLIIHNTIGQQVATHTIPPNHTILLDQHPKGIYYVQTHHLTTPIKTKLIIQ